MSHDSICMKRELFKSVKNGRNAEDNMFCTSGLTVTRYLVNFMRMGWYRMMP